MNPSFVNICRKIKQFIAVRWHTPCLLCQWPSEELVCEDCVQFLPAFTPGCIQCGFPILYARTAHCEACFIRAPHFDRVDALFHYLWPVHQWVQKMKFQKKLELSDYFGKLMVERFKLGIAPDLLLPVPLHSSRQKERGYNQAIEIAKPISNALSLPIASHAVKRIKLTTPQTATSSKARWMNLEDAFEIKENVAGRSILIIDDVMTTGATVNALSKALKQQGALYVQVWCVCRSC